MDEGVESGEVDAGKGASHRETLTLESPRRGRDGGHGALGGVARWGDPGQVEQVLGGYGRHGAVVNSRDRLPIPHLRRRGPRGAPGDNPRRGASGFAVIRVSLTVGTPGTAAVPGWRTYSLPRGRRHGEAPAMETSTGIAVGHLARRRGMR